MNTATKFDEYTNGSGIYTSNGFVRTHTSRPTSRPTDWVVIVGVIATVAFVIAAVVVLL